MVMGQAEEVAGISVQRKEAGRDLRRATGERGQQKQGRGAGGSGTGQRRMQNRSREENTGGSGTGWIRNRKQVLGEPLES